MFDLFIRTTSQGLQAFMPIAFALSAFRRSGRTNAVAAIRWALWAAAPATILAGYLFQHTLRPSLWEAMLATVAVCAVIWILRSFDRRIAPVALAAAALLLIVRQTMEIDVVFAVAAFELRSRDAVTAIGGATALTAGLAIAWTWAARRLDDRAFAAATRTFAVALLGLLAIYAFHESAEARLLPFSDFLHAATEPYGPDGIYGRYFAWLLLAAPMAATIAGRRRTTRRPRAVPALRIGGAVAAVLSLIAVGSGRSLQSTRGTTAEPAGEIVTMTNGPHLLFRHTVIDQQYGTLAIASLADPAAKRLSTGLPCERVAFAGGHGICLQAARGVFTTYRAVLFDQRFKTLATWVLTGGPSRTRVAADGRVGAITVFVTGHAYGTSPFSTKTTLVDMASGDPLGDLEEFATWRDGSRFKAQDFNFWGVTFGRDSNNFFATLSTGGKTYLVKGDLGLRKLTVIHEGVECPSLSPDERSIAFKKRVAAGPGRWRLYVLDLATMSERPIAAETRNVDDQMEWLDDAHVLYALPREASATTDVWVAPVDGSTAAKIFAAGAESPAVVR